MKQGHDWTQNSSPFTEVAPQKNPKNSKVLGVIVFFNGILC